MPTAESANKNEISLARRVSIVLADRNNRPKPVKADASGNLPTSIMVLAVGMWRTPYHGDIMVTPEDLQEYADNFAAGIGISAHGKAPIDYGHNSWEKAAGWMTKLYVKGDALWADVEWTPEGAKSLVEGEYKCFSPEFYPKGRGGWMDPQDYDHIVENVVVGGGLTNIPLFRDMEPVMASAGTSNGTKNVIFIKASETKEKSMQLDDIRKLDPASLTEEQKDFIAQNKADLTIAEQKAFGLETTSDKKDDPAPAADDDTVVDDHAELGDAIPAPVAASIKKAGLTVVKADRLAALESTAEQYQTDKAYEVVDKHIERGALKADRRDSWAKRLVKANAAERKELEEELDALNGNSVMASKQGADAKAGEAHDVTEELKEKTLAKLEASREKNPNMTYGGAQELLLKEDPDLAKRVEAHRAQQAGAVK